MDINEEVENPTHERDTGILDDLKALWEKPKSSFSRRTQPKLESQLEPKLEHNWLPCVTNYYEAAHRANHVLISESMSKSMLNPELKSGSNPNIDSESNPEARSKAKQDSEGKPNALLTPELTSEAKTKTEGVITSRSSPKLNVMNDSVPRLKSGTEPKSDRTLKSKNADLRSLSKKKKPKPNNVSEPALELNTILGPNSNSEFKSERKTKNKLNSNNDQISKSNPECGFKQKSKLANKSELKHPMLKNNSPSKLKPTANNGSGRKPKSQNYSETKKIKSEKMPTPEVKLELKSKNDSETNPKAKDDSAPNREPNPESKSVPMPESTPPKTKIRERSVSQGKYTSFDSGNYSSGTEGNADGPPGSPEEQGRTANQQFKKKILEELVNRIQTLNDLELDGLLHSAQRFNDTQNVSNADPLPPFEMQEHMKCQIQRLFNCISYPMPIEIPITDLPFDELFLTTIPRKSKMPEPYVQPEPKMDPIFKSNSNPEQESATSASTLDLENDLYSPGMQKPLSTINETLAASKFEAQLYPEQWENPIPNQPEPVPSPSTVPYDMDQNLQIPSNSLWMSLCRQRKPEPKIRPSFEDWVKINDKLFPPIGVQQKSISDPETIAKAEAMLETNSEAESLYSIWIEMRDQIFPPMKSSKWQNFHTTQDSPQLQEPKPPQQPRKGSEFRAKQSEKSKPKDELKFKVISIKLPTDENTKAKTKSEQKPETKYKRKNKRNQYIPLDRCYEPAQKRKVRVKSNIKSNILSNNKPKCKKKLNGKPKPQLKKKNADPVCKLKTTVKPAIKRRPKLRDNFGIESGCKRNHKKEKPSICSESGTHSETKEVPCPDTKTVAEPEIDLIKDSATVQEDDHISKSENICSNDFHNNNIAKRRRKNSSQSKPEIEPFPFHDLLDYRGCLEDLFHRVWILCLEEIKDKSRRKRSRYIRKQQNKKSKTIVEYKKKLHGIFQNMCNIAFNLEKPPSEVQSVNTESETLPKAESSSESQKLETNTELFTSNQLNLSNIEHEITTQPNTEDTLNKSEIATGSVPKLKLALNTQSRLELILETREHRKMRIRQYLLDVTRRVYAAKNDQCECQTACQTNQDQASNKPNKPKVEQPPKKKKKKKKKKRRPRKNH